MKTVYISTNDPIIYVVYDEEESSELFGDEMIEDYGTNIPDDLLLRYKETYKKFWSIQDEIRQIKAL